MLRTVSRGLEAPLEHYQKLSLDGTSVYFLDVQCQGVLRANGMAQFLAHSQLETERNAQRYDLTVGGREVLAGSRSLHKKQDIPITEVDKLEAAVRSLLDKAKDQELPPTSRQLIKQFKLPDPDREPEMYRLYGWPWNRRLGVIWGCERVSGSGLPPLEALERLRRRGIPGWIILCQRLGWLVGTLLMLALLVWLGLLAAGMLPVTPEPGKSPHGGKPLPPDGVVARQFLKVMVKPTKGKLPRTITATASEPGRIVFSQSQKILRDTNAAADAPSSITVENPGEYRIVWHPTDTGKFNGEFINLFVDETTEEVPPKPDDPPVPVPSVPVPPVPVPSVPVPSVPVPSVPVPSVPVPPVLPTPDEEPVQKLPDVDGSGELQIELVKKLPLRLRVSRKGMPQAELANIEWSIGSPAKTIRGQREIEITVHNEATDIKVNATHQGVPLTGKSVLKVAVELTK